MKRKLRQKRIRKKIKGTSSCPRLCVFRSLRGVFLQIIDDEKGKTLVSANYQEIKKSKKNNTKTKTAELVGKLIAKKALKKKIKKVVFDRSGYLYHGQVKAVADGARAAGLKF